MVSLAWVPFALAAATMRHEGALVGFLVVLSVFSFVHQPLTLPLVYGDAAQFAARRQVFTYAPFVLVGAIAVGWTISFTLVAVAGGLWNMEHTLMQRYGFVRIYGRKAGEDDGRLERLLLVSWLVVTLLWIAADARTHDRIASLRLGHLNETSLDVLASFRPYAIAALAPCAIASLALTIRWLRIERARIAARAASAPKLVYMASTAAMFAWAILVDPIAGFAGYAGAHAVEYFFIVDHRLAANRSRADRRWFFATYLSAFTAVYVLLYSKAPAQTLTATILFFGGLHFLYDGFIWKRRSSPAMQLQAMAPKVNA